MKIVKVALIVSILMSVLMTGCKNSYTLAGVTTTDTTLTETTNIQISETSKPTEEKIIAYQVVYNDVDTEQYFAVNTEHIYEKEKLVDNCYHNKDIFIPQVECEDKAVEEKINTVLKNSAEQKQKAFTDSLVKLDNAGMLPKEAADILKDKEYIESTYEVTCNTPELLSIVIVDNEQHYGAAHGNITTYTYNFNSKTGELIDFENYFTDKENINAVLMQALVDYMAVNRWYGDTFTVDDKYYKDLKLYLTDNSPKRYFVEKGSFGFIIAPYEYGCFADGLRKVSVPLDDIRPYLTEEGIKIFENMYSCKKVLVNSPAE